MILIAFAMRFSSAGAFAPQANCTIEPPEMHEKVPGRIHPGTVGFVLFYPSLLPRRTRCADNPSPVL
jgi:hypothetical protein